MVQKGLNLNFGSCWAPMRDKQRGCGEAKLAPAGWASLGAVCSSGPGAAGSDRGLQGAWGDEH